MTHEQRRTIQLERRQNAVVPLPTPVHSGNLKPISLFQRRKFRATRRRRWKPKPQDMQTQLVLMKGRRMRCITKADGRKIYRSPRKQQNMQWWKLRQQKTNKKRKSEKARLGFRHIARAHNDLELRVVRKRRLFSRQKRMKDYMG
jgi:hypothetical protein